MLRKVFSSIESKGTVWLRQGTSPRRLAFTLALGFAIGCFPVVGIPTAMCAVLALTLRLNLPAIEAANYFVMPLQFVLIVPFVRLGGWLFASGTNRAPNLDGMLHASPRYLLSQLSGMAGHAMLAWLLTSVPAVLVLTAILTVLLRRIPALAEAEAAD
jgi:uncharacterized protein (DUF2062 family)